jgi:ATP-dependent Clp protease protease subunit
MRSNLMSKPNNNTGAADAMHFNPNDNFIWVNEFSDESLIDFYRGFTAKEDDPTVKIITVIISSYGGEIASLMAMRDLVKSSSKPVATVALGKAMSAGACLLAAGTKGFRFASKDTLIMIHEVSGGAIGKTADVVESAQVMGELNEKLLANLAEDCGQTYEEIETQIRSKKNADWTLSSSLAKKWGIIDHVAIPRNLILAPERELMNVVSYDQLKAEEVRRISLAKTLAAKVKTKPKRKR